MNVFSWFIHRSMDFPNPHNLDIPDDMDGRPDWARNPVDKDESNLTIRATHEFSISLCSDLTKEELANCVNDQIELPLKVESFHVDNGPGSLKIHMRVAEEDEEGNWVAFQATKLQWLVRKPSLAKLLQEVLDIKHKDQKLLVGDWAKKKPQFNDVANEGIYTVSFAISNISEMEAEENTPGPERRFYPPKK
eukprot:m.21462 g.21462  ORF g.21462 m.21462 type:complete len:192 (+) comp7154_c0_seq1:179-754(+)